MKALNARWYVRVLVWPNGSHLCQLGRKACEGFPRAAIGRYSDLCRGLICD